MPVVKGLEWTFDTNAETYAKIRPGYVDELYRDIFRAIPLDKNSTAVEIGIGGGQATLPILQTGCRVTAVEYGENFVTLCREKFRDYPNFSAVTGKFEDYAGAENSCDLIYSASAFHWIPEEIGYPKVFQMLRPGGIFARFANHPYPDKGREGLSDAIQEVYYRHGFSKRKPKEYGEEEAAARAEIAGKYGFTEIGYALYYRTRTFTAREYPILLSTYSDHIAIEPIARAKFFAEIQQTIEAFGGEITIYDTIDLQLARKP